MILRRLGLILAALMTTPVLLFIYQPAWKLGGFGLLLGMIGMMISPIIILFCVIYTVNSLWH